MSDVAAISVSETRGVAHAFQFGQRLWLVDFSCERLADSNHAHEHHWHAQNALLAAYAALEALALETALDRYPALYAKRGWRHAGLEEKFADYLLADQRQGTRIPAAVQAVAEHRRAMTHSEPDNVRTSAMNLYLAANAPAQLADDVRRVADWLWNGTVPTIFAAWWPARRPSV